MKYYRNLLKTLSWREGISPCGYLIYLGCFLDSHAPCLSRSLWRLCTLKLMVKKLFYA